MADTLANHDHPWSGAVNVAPLLEELAGDIIRAKIDNRVPTVGHAEDRPVLSVHLGVSAPRMSLRHLTEVANDWDSGRSWRKLASKGIVAVRDDGEYESDGAY